MIFIGDDWAESHHDVSGLRKVRLYETILSRTVEDREGCPAPAGVRNVVCTIRVQVVHIHIAISVGCGQLPIPLLTSRRWRRHVGGVGTFVDRLTVRARPATRPGPPRGFLLSLLAIEQCLQDRACRAQGAGCSVLGWWLGRIAPGQRVQLAVGIAATDDQEVGQGLLQ